jgi:NTP pyrophosphatase (non-canonical NTP hydrolase)
MTYYLYHIPGKKVGVTRDLEKRVIKQQGYDYHEFEVLLESENIDFISNMEIAYQIRHGYRVDEIPYNELKFNNTEMNINITEQTTTFPCPVNKLKGRLMDNIGMTWETDHGVFFINEYSIKWIMANIKTSMFNDQRSYVYNKAFARFYDNHQTHDMLGGNLADAHMRDKYPSNGHETRTGGLAPTGMKERKCDKGECLNPTQFDLIRDWANERGLYDKGDPKTQTLKLMEEAGEICRAVLKDNRDDVIDGIGDCVVVLTNLAELIDMSIEDCIEVAYAEISNRTGKMVNGTFKKD